MSFGCLPFFEFSLFYSLTWCPVFYVSRAYRNDVLGYVVLIHWRKSSYWSTVRASLIDHLSAPLYAYFRFMTRCEVFSDIFVLLRFNYVFHVRMKRHSPSGVSVGRADITPFSKTSHVLVNTTGQIEVFRSSRHRWAGPTTFFHWQIFIGAHKFKSMTNVTTLFWKDEEIYVWELWQTDYAASAMFCWNCTSGNQSMSQNMSFILLSSFRNSPSRYRLHVLLFSQCKREKVKHRVVKVVTACFTTVCTELAFGVPTSVRIFCYSSDALSVHLTCK
jgi:hypothetical protein